MNVALRYSGGMSAVEMRVRESIFGLRVGGKGRGELNKLNKIDKNLLLLMNPFKGCLGGRIFRSDIRFLQPSENRFRKRKSLDAYLSRPRRSF
jgi:hypothetical protein